MDERNRGLTLIEIIVTVVVVIVLASLLLPTMSRSVRRARITACANNLSQLWKMEVINITQAASRARLMPTETGREFWLVLRKVDLVEGNDLFNCPMLGQPGPDCQYRGPGADVNGLPAGTVIGADDIRNHGGQGGNVMRKGGEVEVCGSQEEFERLTNQLK